MAATAISDLSIVPEIFMEYVEKMIMEKSKLFTEGLVVNVPTFIPSKGYDTVAPSWLGFEGDDEVLSDSGSLTVNSVGSINAKSVINFRGKSFGANDLVDMLAGSDPLGDLAGKYADYWRRMLNRATWNSLKGAVAGVEAAHSGLIINDISAEIGVLANITAETSLDTKQLMGEYSEQLGLVAMNSAVHTYLRKNDLTNTYVLPSDPAPVETYMQCRVVIDDTIAVSAGNYDTYFMAPGTFVYSEGIDPRLAIETDRDILAGDDIVASRKRFILHPSGATWIGASVAGEFPTNAELATAANWTAEDTGEDKRFPVRVLRHKINVTA